MSNTSVSDFSEEGRTRAADVVTDPLSELTAYARIRAAALRLFADRGVAATSIRAVAEAARVSPGVVQHHYGTKDGLRHAVDLYVTLLAQDELIRQNEAALRYVARGVAEENPGALRIFDVLVTRASEHVPERTAVELIMRTLSDALLRPAIERHRDPTSG